MSAGCFRSHPHEEMDATCARFAEYEERLAGARVTEAVLYGIVDRAAMLLRSQVNCNDKKATHLDEWTEHAREVAAQAFAASMTSGMAVDSIASERAAMREALREVTDILGSALGLTNKHAEAVKRARAILEGVES
jgi:hypothetical protein